MHGTSVEQDCFCTAGVVDWLASKLAEEPITRTTCPVKARSSSPIKVLAANQSTGWPAKSGAKATRSKAICTERALSANNLFLQNIVKEDGILSSFTLASVILDNKHVACYE